MSETLNQTLLVSGVDYFSDELAINPFMDSKVRIDKAIATTEHVAAINGYRRMGSTVTQVTPPPACQDGVYTANWAFILDGTAVMSRLPKGRTSEEPYAENVLRQLGISTSHAPENWLFSGQGDMLYIPGTRLIIGGYGYRSDRRMHDFIAKKYDCEVVSLHAIPQRVILGYHNLRIGAPHINPVSGIADSPAYDIDLAVGIVRGAAPGQKPIIAYCPWLLDRASRQLMAGRTDLDKIIVSRREALQAYACNLVSNGETVVLNAGAGGLIAQLQARGLKTIGLTNREISKGGGGYRCMTLTVDHRTPISRA